MTNRTWKNKFRVFPCIEVGFLILERVICTKTGFFHGQEFEGESSLEQLKSSRDRRLWRRNTVKMQVVYSCWKTQFII